MRELYERENRKLSAIFCIFAFLLCLAWGASCHGLTAHAADQTARVTKQVNTYMTAIKKYDINKIKKMQIDKDVFHITDKRLQKYIRKINRENLSYEIKRIKIKGSSATVFMRVRYYSAQCDFENAIKKVLYDYKKSWSSKKFSKELYGWLKWAYDPEDEAMIFNINVKIPMTKKGNKWMINKMNENLFYIKDGGLTHYMDDFSKHPDKYL